MSSILKVLTYNIHKGFSVGNMRFVLHQIREHLQHLDADLVFLQEILGAHSKHAQTISDWPAATQLEFLADKLWQHHAYAKNAIYADGHHGNAILSRYPIISWENINVSSMKFASRSFLHGIIHIPHLQRKVHVICVHFDLFEHHRKRQINILSERIHSHIPSDEPLIIAGDFNDWRGRASGYFAENLNLQEAFKTQHGNYARSFPAWFPTLPVDRIYYRGIQPIKAELLKDRGWKKLSDHMPLYAEFELV
ncbi:MAG: endonuclease/exonuclease/phosphatase family protein [Gammaproteobacteria bacterium]|nr:endonuclease/exonuclease/phosphatase family protein [Gammaproteobacteria bacterium]